MQVVRYYDECLPYYRVGWGSLRNLCIHYGYHEDGLSHDRALIRMVEVLAEKARITREDKVLDAGCGLGGASIWLAQNIGCEVWALDINPNLVFLAAREAEKRGLEITFYVGNFERMPLLQRFTVVWFLESFCYAVDKARTLKEASRVLLPGGRVVIADACRADGVDLDLTGWAVPGIPTEREFIRYAEEAGFRPVLFEDISEKVEPSSRRIRNLAVLTYPLAWLLYLLRLKSRITLEHTRLALRQYEYGREGRGKYFIFVGAKQ